MIPGGSHLALLPWKVREPASIRLRGHTLTGSFVMPVARAHALRRRLAVLALGLLAVLGVEVSLPGSSLAPGTAIAVADSGSAYDRSLGADECALLGRAFTPDLGCSRARCVDGRGAVAQGPRRGGVRPGGSAAWLRVRRHR